MTDEWMNVTAETQSLNQPYLASPRKKVIIGSNGSF